ncbi:Golgi SNAP receptor complex member 1-2-like protein [Drosera capensis]
MELQESGWEELRKEARKIEGDLDVKLSSYAKLGARFSQSGYVDNGSPTLGSSRSWKSMEMEIQSLLEKLLDVNDAMIRCAASAAPTTSVTQKLARHRDILHEFTQEFRRIKGNINSMREHAELLSSVRDDISEYKASGSMSPKVQILRERAAIHGSISHIDDVINQAQTTRVALGSQRALFGDIGGKVKILGEKFPIIHGLLGSVTISTYVVSVDDLDSGVIGLSSVVLKSMVQLAFQLGNAEQLPQERNFAIQALELIRSVTPSKHS